MRAQVLVAIYVLLCSAVSAADLGLSQFGGFSIAPPTAASRESKLSPPNQTLPGLPRSARIPDVEFYVGSDKIYAIENITVTMWYLPEGYYADVKYATNANYGAGSNDNQWYLTVWLGGTPVNLSQMKWAAYCQQPRTRQYNYRIPIPKAVYEETTKISTPAMSFGSHSC